MRASKLFSRSIAKWTLAVSCVTMGSVAMESPALGHFPFHHHHGCYSSFGWGSHYYGGYSSFYGLSSSYYYPSLSYSFGYTPRCYSVNYYTPTYFAPVYYSPVYYAPAYYPCSSWSSVQTGVGFPVASNSFPPASTAKWFATSNQANSPIAPQARTFQTNSPLSGIPVSKIDSHSQATKVSKAAINEPGIRLVSNKPALLQPYSPIWTKAAVGIVDDMVAAGELDHALSSCKSMERITQPKGAGVYLRQALLKYFSNDGDSAQKPSTDEILRLLELACEAGSQMLPSELSKDSLNDYFAACLVDVNGKLEQLSQSVLESPNHSGRELLLLSALLKLDGQADRAKLFASEVQEQVAKSGSFRWNSLLDACLN